MIGREGMESSCARGGSGWVLGRISSQKSDCWHRLPRELVESPSLELLKQRTDVAFRGVLWWVLLVVGG